jgi:antirestriction protein ArdC
MYFFYTSSVTLPLVATPAEAYYSTKLYELTHWTGIESRCNRQFEVIASVVR